jgi:hypothetical protein
MCGREPGLEHMPKLASALFWPMARSSVAMIIPLFFNVLYVLKINLNLLQLGEKVGCVVNAAWKPSIE